MIIFMAGLQSIPKDLYEAADIDGASKWKQFYSITVPLLSPTTFFLLVSGIIGTFKVFDVISVLTNGGPANSTSVVVYRLYETAFVNLQSGYASAMAIVLLVLVLLITLIQWFGQRKWVNY
jgi:multiple sugar transport system permease protein